MTTSKERILFLDRNLEEVSNNNNHEDFSLPWLVFFAVIVLKTFLFHLFQDVYLFSYLCSQIMPVKGLFLDVWTYISGFYTRLIYQLFDFNCLKLCFSRCESLRFTLFSPHNSELRIKETLTISRIYLKIAKKILFSLFDSKFRTFAITKQCHAPRIDYITKSWNTCWGRRLDKIELLVGIFSSFLLVGINSMHIICRIGVLSCSSIFYGLMTFQLRQPVKYRMSHGI